MAEGLRTYTVQVSSTQEMVYRTLRDEIVTMRLKPGTAISTQDTAARLGVSRTPVREAFIRLQRENLLTITPQKVTQVSRINLKRVYQERFIREALEVENLSKFVSVATPEDLSRMRRNIARQRLAMEEKRYTDFIELDNDFHLIALRATSQNLGAEIMRQMNGHYDRIRLITAWEEHIATASIDQHSQMVDDIEAGRLTETVELLRHHLQQLYIHEKGLVENWADYFEDE